MNKVLLTGGTSFLGYHVARQLNAQGIRPRVLELPGANRQPLARLQVDQCDGDLSDRDAISRACEGVHTLLHAAFKVSVGGGAALVEEMRAINVGGTQQLLDVAAAKGVLRAVIIGSALAIGVNRQPKSLDESADSAEHRFELPYAITRLEAEREALSRSRPGFAVMSVAPAFTLGPDDPVGAPANKLVKAVISGKMPITLPVGFGCLDVRDFASGMLLAAERGAGGRRYLLSGENVTTNQFLKQAAAAGGVKPPRLQPPAFLLHMLVAGLEGVSALRRRPAPVTRDVLQILHRYAWYDTTRARTELGWSSRPLQQTIEDTVRWLREQPA